ncbi:MAG: methyltransferase domain-containing protein [Pyrinomonadaceae bacterium]|nr:methyltransferase domain-containing protein [Pyrinomonadaceae bacterium]
MNDLPHLENYEKQDRGNRDAYEAYFAGMDASMQQKIALTTAHFPVRGRIADMGSGSGRGTFDLASLYQGLELVGVDINPVSVARSTEQYRRPNLHYVVGDIATTVFPENSLDGILDSSVLHHVTSFNDFDVNRVLTTLDRQVAQLKTGGVIIIRDFVIPRRASETIYLDLPEQDGRAEGSIKYLSTAALFERFSETWRSSVNYDSPVSYARLASPRAGFARYKVSLRAAAEFVLRKDYRADWDTEILEEYTYLSQSQFEEAFRARGLRIVTSMPLWNPWIVENRFVGRFHLADLNETPLPFPPTNYLIVGEKVSSRAGVELVEEQRQILKTPQFLSLTSYRHKESGDIYELAERPNLTIDLLPWFENAGQIFVLAKKDFPRPVVNACADQPTLNGSSLSGYITEPVSAIVDSINASEEVVSHILAERAGLNAEDILNLGAPFTYYTSPGGINERVTARLVEVRPRRMDTTSIPNYTKFTDAGTVRELDAHQTLRASHVGGMFDARLEINIYRLLRALHLSPGSWIGAPVALTTQDVSSPLNTSEDALSPLAHAAFEVCTEHTAPQFLSLHEGAFTERSCDGETLAEASFEYVVPQHLSKNTIVALPVLQTTEGIFVGIEHRDLPAAQTFAGSSRIAVAPAWRLPFTVKDRLELEAFLAKVMARDFGIGIRRSWELGGSYFPTPGITPEVVYPFVVEIGSINSTQSELKFVEINQLAARLDSIQDAHLMIAACRLIHALDVRS